MSFNRRPVTGTTNEGPQIFLAFGKEEQDSLHSKSRLRVALELYCGIDEARCDAYR